MPLVIDVSCKGMDGSQRILLEDEQTLEVGRANDKLNLASDPRLSRKHFAIRYINRQIEITHLSRTNPTLVAIEGEAEFKPVQGRQVEGRSCRIIAGSHRFVAVVEAPDSIIEPTLSGEDHAEIWSDVDAEGDPFEDSIDETPRQPADPARETLTTPKASPPPTAKKTAASPAPPTGKPVFSLDDSFDGRSGMPPANPVPPKPRQEVLTDFTPVPPAAEPEDDSDNKIFFPIEDDFFD